MANIGNSPGVASQRVVTTFTATAGQTLFVPNGGYTLGYCDVFLNGIKLVNGDDYTAANGINFTLTSGAAVGDAVECVAYFPRGLSDGYMKAEADTLLALKFDKLGGDVSGRTVFKDPYRADQSYPLGIKNGSQQEWWFRAEPTSNTFDLALNGFGDVIKCDTAGRVITPYQPGFAAQSSAGETVYTGTNEVITAFSSPIFNTGNHYNTANGRFTAPVSGSYLFCATVWKDQNTALQSAIGIFKNGGQWDEARSHSVNDVRYTKVVLTTVVNLAANEYIELRTTGFNQRTMVANGQYSKFSGYLLG
jgi:hypothetical protein